MEEGRKDESIRREKRQRKSGGDKSYGRKREEKRKRAIVERQCFVCRIFGHMAHYCRNRREERLVQMLSNKFEVLKAE